MLEKEVEKYQGKLGLYPVLPVGQLPSVQQKLCFEDGWEYLP